MAGDGTRFSVPDGQTAARLTSSHLERCPRRVEVASARRVAAVLDELRASRDVSPGKSAELDARALFDPRLVREKEILQAYPPVRIRCERGHTLDWIALAPLSDHGFQLVHGSKLHPPSARQGGRSTSRAGPR